MSWSDPFWAALIGLGLTGWVRLLIRNQPQNPPAVAWASFLAALTVLAIFKLFVR